MEIADNPELASVIGKRLRVFRESKSLPQIKLAAAVGGTIRGIQDNELGKSAPNSKVLYGLALMGLNVNWLLTGEGPMLIGDLALRGSRPPKIDQEILAYAIEALDEELKRRKEHRSSAQYANLIGILYNYCLETGERDGSLAAQLAKIA